MVFLKKILITVIFIQSFSLVTAQDYEKLQKAFQKSYQAESDSNFVKAIEVLNDLYTSSSYEINLRFGWLYYQLGQYQKSVQYYDQAIKNLPYSEEAKIGKTYPLSAMAEWEQIISLYKQILQNSPNNTSIAYKLGYIYYNHKDYEKSYSYFKKIVELYPFSYSGLIMYAWVNYQLGRTNEAKILFNKILMLSPNDASATRGLRLINGKN